MERLAERCHRSLEPLHSMIYFSMELQERLVAAGLKPGRMCVFASRVAAMGAVRLGAVAGVFYPFNPEFIGRYIPLAWTLASPERIVAGRFEAADGALRRLLGPEAIGSAELAEAASLARTAADGCVHNGRPLYAALAELDWPAEPHLVLWHAVTLLREFRGDGHVAALVAHGLDGLEALITHTATGTGFQELASKALRGWSDEQWAEAVRRLRDQNILDESGALTEAGVALRQSLEEDTNRLRQNRRRRRRVPGRPLRQPDRHPRGGSMIARMWRGWAPAGAAADDYQRHYESEVADHLRQVAGFRGARLLRQKDGAEVQFTSITFFTGMDAVRGFAGEEFDKAVLEPEARRVLSRWDERVSHHDVALDL
jgi:Helix-turn-helix family